MKLKNKKTENSEFIENSLILFADSNDSKKCLNILKHIDLIRKELETFDSLVQKKDSVPKSNFISALDTSIKRLNEESLALSEEKDRKKLKKIFRDHIQQFLFESPLFKRGYLKPKGFAGDYQIIERMYNNVPVAQDNSIGYYLDKYFLRVEYVQSVRDRKNEMKRILKEYILNHKSKKLKILNLACGSCREIREIISEGFNCKEKKIEFVLVDQDQECLDFSKKQLATAPENYKFHFIKNHVLYCLLEEEFFKRFGKFDLIYSIGLADYLPNSVLGAMFKYCLKRIVNDGKIIVAHKNVREHASPISDWMCDWNFIPRDMKDIKQMMKEYIITEQYKFNCKFLGNRLIYFCILKKRSFPFLLTIH